MADPPRDEGPRYRPDGWPVDVTFADDPAVEHERFQQAMRSLQARWRAGDLTAFDEAISECWRRREAPEKWLKEASAEIVRLAMAEEEKRARRKWDIHRRRWEAVSELRERRHELFERFGDDRGTSLERARHAVSEMFLEKDDEAKGSEPTIRYSYELVEEAGGERATFEDYKAVLRKREGGIC
jgi:hypothetical protein